MSAKMVEMMDELTTPERQRDSGTGANDGYTDLEMIEKDNETLRELVRELEAKLEQWETFYKSEMQRERDNYNAAIKNANNIVAQLKEYERGAWNEAIAAAAKSCEGEEYKHYGGYFAEEIRGLKK